MLVTCLYCYFLIAHQTCFKRNGEADHGDFRAGMNMLSICHKLYTEKMTILKNYILRHIYNIQNSSLRWDATAKLYYFLLFLSRQIMI